MKYFCYSIACVIIEIDHQEIVGTHLSLLLFLIREDNDRIRRYKIGQELHPGYDFAHLFAARFVNYSFCEMYLLSKYFIFM